MPVNASDVRRRNRREVSLSSQTPRQSASRERAGEPSEGAVPGRAVVDDEKEPALAGRERDTVS